VLATPESSLQNPGGEDLQNTEEGTGQEDPEIPLPSTLGRKGVRDPQEHILQEYKTLGPPGQFLLLYSEDLLQLLVESSQEVASCRHTVTNSLHAPSMTNTINYVYTTLSF